METGIDIRHAAARRRRFVVTQGAKAATGAVLGLVLVAVAGRPDPAEVLALAWLLLPVPLAAAGLAGLSLPVLEQLSLIAFAGLIAWLAALTGGVTSPLTVWFLLVPAEAALAGGRVLVVRAGLAAGAGLLAVAAVQAAGHLPPSRLVLLPVWEVATVSLLAALVQAVLIAVAAQDRQRAAAARGIMAVTRDMSGRKAQEQALVEARDAALAASRAKSRFLANMSHELRTPLNAIIGFSEMMAREMFGPLDVRYQDYARLVHESGAHLLDLINSVLDMSKIEAGKFALHEELFDLDETARAALAVLKLSAERAGVALVLSVAPQARMAFADRRAVKQILVNLLSNGVKFTPPGGTVRVAVAVAQGIEIVVSDTGTGISPADLARLGKPFEQVETSESRAKEGTGLGLALVKSLAALHGGEALLSSVLGEGTMVTVRLPHAAVNARGERLADDGIVPFRALG